MADSTRLAVVLAVALVLAGCSGAPGTQPPGTEAVDATTTGESTSPATASEPTTSDDSATTTPTTAATTTTTASTTTDEPAVRTENCPYRGANDDDIVRESGACLPFDADTVYRRVAEMAGVDVERGPTLSAIPASDTLRYSFNFNNATFGATMGIAPTDEPNLFVPGYASPNRNPDGSVEPAVTMRYVGLWNDTDLQEQYGFTYTPADAEVTAAHEFLHVIQFYRGSQQRLARNLTSEGVNAETVRLAVIEGSATFFESEYQRRYMGRPNATRNVSAWANASAYAMQQLGPYVLGSRYTRWYLDGSTENFEKLYDDPPVSMEQIIHRYEPDEELPKELSVRGRVSSDWARPSFPETKGELFLRAALRSGVNGSAAARGAAGWGQDGVVTFQNASYSRSGVYKRGYGWAIRFDDASEAEEFRTIFQRWLAETGTLEDGVYVASTDRTFRLVSVSNETVVVLAGHEQFTRRATVSGNTTRVVVEHTDSDRTMNATTNDATGWSENDRVVAAPVE